MTKILPLHPQTDQLLGELNNRGEKLFFLDKHIQEIEGEHSHAFTMPSTIPEARHFGERGRFLIPSEEKGFHEFIIFKTFTTMNNQKNVLGIAAYTEMDKSHIVEPGSYTGTLEELANQVLPFTEYRLGVFEDIRIRTVNIEEHIGAYAFLVKVAKAFEIEMRFRVEVTGTRFTGRYLDFVKKVGSDIQKEVVYGKDLIGMEMTVHSERIVTELLCIGPEKEDGTRLTAIVRDEDAFQRWNRKGKPIIGIYMPESSRQEMTLEELEQYGRTELNKRIASVVEYKIKAASIEKAYPHEKVRLGSTLRIKNPKFEPPLYADARAIRVERSIVDESQKTYTIGEVVTYSEEDIYKTFRQLQAQYNLRVIRSETPPAGNANKIWIQITPGSDLEVPHVWSEQLGQWIKIAPTTADEIGAETPEGAQNKADTAEGNAKQHADVKDQEVREDVGQVIDNQKQAIDQAISQTRTELETDLAEKAGLNYVDGKFSLVDSELSAMLGDINLITGDVSGITNQISGLQSVSDDLLARVATSESELLANGGRLTTVETNVDEVKGTMSATISTLSNLEGTISNQQTQINANATAISLKASQASLDTLTGSVSDMSAELSVQGNAIALKAEASALTTVDNKVTGLQNDYAELVVNVNGISTSVSSLTAEVEGMEIGGRNYFSGTSVPAVITSFGNGVNETTGVYYAINPEALSGNFFLSFDVDLKDIVATNESDSRLSFQIRIERPGYSTRYDTFGNIYEFGDGKVRIETPVKIHSGSTIIQLRLRADYIKSGVVTVSKGMLEKSTKAGDWTPAVEDVDASISNVQQYASSVDQKADSIITNVNALTQTVDGHTTSISNAQAGIATLSDSVALKAEQTQVDTIGGQVTSVSNQVAGLAVSVNGITTSVSSLRSDLDGLEVGGRNLLTGTSKEYKSITFSGWDAYFQDVAGKVKAGETLTGRLYLKPQGEEVRVMLEFRDAGGNYRQYHGNIISPGSEGYSTVTATIPQGFDVSVRMSRRHSSGGTPSAKVEYKEVKLERGSIATDHTQAPEDIDSRFSSAESSINQLADEIDLKVNKDGVIAAINLTSETARIQAKNIDLVGAVSVLSDITSTFTSDSYGVTEIRQGGMLIHDGTRSSRLSRNSLIFGGGDPYINTTLLLGFGLDSADDGLITVQDTRALRVKKASGAYADIYASNFNNGSSRTYKTNIEKLEDVGLTQINQLSVMEYDLIDDIHNGTYNNRQIGLISEDSQSVATADGLAINMYKLASLNVKATQELSTQVSRHDKRINDLEIENQFLKLRVKALEEAN